ncbi:uncharacterized protein LOC130046340 isoform X2 [Ostrea edulis]|uniref:uncharacterized protein LOC130046340 isoform X2 n=1 Tax=Ostrea edulis TaxID=37623 RepID=UPI0024AEB840|nr:uncharacterized protein LOC130046340 isoform X2 [Ostrea edulis]
MEENLSSGLEENCGIWRYTEMTSHMFCKFHKYIVHVYQLRVHLIPTLHLLNINYDLILKLKFQPFAPDDAVHYYFSREWSRVQFQPQLDLVEECMEETIVKKSINEEEMEEIVKDKENISKKEGKEGTSKEDCMEGTFNVEGIKETEGVVIKKEDIKETIEESQRITQYDHVDGENDEEENENPYIRLMTSPLILEGLLLKNQEDNTKKSSKESKIPRDEVGTLSNFLSTDKKNSSNLLKRWSWLNPFTPKNKKRKEQKNQEKKTKKERRAMLLFFRLFGR